MPWAKYKVGDFTPDLRNMARSLNLDPFVYYENFSGKITGLGASILLGYSMEWLWGNVLVVAPSRSIDGLFTGCEKFVYLENYDRQTGFNEYLPSPERLICDFLMYPEELKFNLYYWDVLEGYIDDDDTPNDFNRVYAMLDFFKIAREKFDGTVRKLGAFRESC